MLVIVKVSTGDVYPAENLRWTQEYQNGNYTIRSIAGVYTSGTNVTVPAEVTTSGSTNDIILAQIGKSGRYVGLTEEYLNP